jgi:hypothetical protein
MVVLLFLAYVWLSALVLGYGMTRVLPAVTGPMQADAVGRLARTVTVGDGSTALLGSPATVYGCELAMTVLTGLMLLS